jgi:hypothetical protein
LINYYGYFKTLFFSFLLLCLEYINVVGIVFLKPALWCIMEKEESELENTEEPFVIVPTGVIVPVKFEVSEIFPG